MSELLSAVAATLGAPEALIQRSADARAVVQGIDAEQVLQAWAGGAALSVDAPVASATAPVAEPFAVQETGPVEEETPNEAPQPAAAVLTAVAEKETSSDPGFEPAPLSIRIRLPAAFGAAVGAAFGVLTAALSAVFFVDNATSIEQGDGFRAAVEVEVLPVVIGMAGLSALFGAVLGLLGRRAPGFFRAEMGVVGGAGVLLGAVVGAALGAIGGGILVGVLGVDTIEEGLVAVPVGAATWWLVIGGALLGAATAVLAHVTAVPSGLAASERHDSSEVRTRLSQSLMVPLVSILALVAVIAIISTLFLVFHEAAAALAIVISAGVLLFAFLGGYRPSIKLRYTEVIAALAGIATVVIAIVMVVVVREH